MSVARPPASVFVRSMRLALRIALSACVGVCALALVEGFASLWTASRDSELFAALSEQSHSRYDPLLGWTHEPGAHVPDLYGPGRSITINAQGLRALEDYTPDVPTGRYRVVFLGDSFTMGYGVDDRDTYPARLEALCPVVQAVNMGMGGFGLGQDMLWYERDGESLAADLLVFAFIDADFYRTELESFSGYPKPRFEVEDGRLVVTNVPVPRSFGRAGLVRRLGEFVSHLSISKLSGGQDLTILEEEALDEAVVGMFDRAERILDAVVEIARRRRQRVALLYLPTRKLVYLGRRSSISKWVEEYATRKDVPLLDVQPAFADFPPTEIVDEIYLPDTHFDARGNGIIAERLLDFLATRVDGFPGCGAAR